ncbi:MAG: arsenate reductase ArsC [Verrucomicrobiota bacterium]
MTDSKYDLLFLCTGNSARSILGEYLLRKMAPLRFNAYSAGANPSGKVNPLVQRVLEEKFLINTDGARSKSWMEFKGFHFDFVITVCDHAKESCPIWPGQPIIAHWSSPDPAEFKGTDEEKIHQIYEVGLQIRRRIELLLSLPIEKMEKLKIEEHVSQIAFENQIASLH